MPDQMKPPFALWTARAVRELIHQKFGKTLGPSTMPLHLKRWGFTAQKFLTPATSRDPQRIAAWLRLDYPRIAARAKREKAAIHWGDETGVRDQDQIAPPARAREVTRLTLRRDLDKSPFPSSFVRMTVGGRGMFVGKLAMVESRGRVLLRLFVLTPLVMMGRLMVMMRSGVVVSGGGVVMLTRRMLLRHLRYSSPRVNNRKNLGYFPHMTRG
jgi:winged helix-turn-helix protein